MAMKALFLNCTLKESPLLPNIRAIVDRMVSILERSRAKSEMIRTAVLRIAVLRIADNSVDNNANVDNNADNNLAFDVTFNVPFIAAHIWFIVLSFVAKVVIKRLDRIYITKYPETRQYFLYGKAARIIVTGNANTTLGIYSTDRLNFTYLSCAVSLSADSNRTGNAGLGQVNMETGEGGYFLLIGRQDNRTAR
jgi:hypothetical protein